MPEGLTSKHYLEFNRGRLAKCQDVFQQEFSTVKIEQEYAGLFCLLRLAQDITEAVIEEATVYLHAFFYPEHHKNMFESTTFVFAQGADSEREEPKQEEKPLTQA